MALVWQRPTVDTKFHIDLDWWEQNQRDIRVIIRGSLCEECRSTYEESYRGLQEIDWVDEQTGEVTRVDALWHTLRACCSIRPDYIQPTTSIVEAVFRTFLASGNQPLTIRQLHGLIDRRPPEMLLRVLTGGPVYMGIRPIYE
jgi:hypothetical protein